MFEPSSTVASTDNHSTEDTSARILIVDDNLINRKKIRLSVRSLGHDSSLAENGMVALEKLRTEPFDVVLLDLVMPEMDGFDVLKALKADKKLSHIPVIVVTAYDEQTESVVKAIELGAEDVLPKDFNPVLLKARLDASLNKKRFRDQEIEYFKRVDALTSAAVVIESGRFSADKLDLDRLSSQPDSLGRLAAVFKGMATEIYNRELKLHRSLHIIQGSFLVVLVGVVWGLSPALSRMLSTAGTNPLGLAVWINLIISTSCFAVAAYRNKLPRLNGREVLFFISWAVIAGVLQRLVTYWVSGNVEAAMISLIVTLQGFIVFAFAALTKLEKATPKRLLGLVIGLIGVALVLWSKFDISAMKQSAWLFAATLLPLLFAIEAIVLAGKRPQHIDIFAAVGLMTGFSVLFLLPLAFFTGNLMSLGPGFGKVEWLTLVLGIGSTLSIILAFRLIAVAGPVFYSQCAYTMTLAGVVWGMLLLDETLPAIAWVAFFFIVIGVYLVEPKPSSDDIIIKRTFTGDGARSGSAQKATQALSKKARGLKIAAPVGVVVVAVACVFVLNGLVGLSSSGGGNGVRSLNNEVAELPTRVKTTLTDSAYQENNGSLPAAISSAVISASLAQVDSQQQTLVAVTDAQVVDPVPTPRVEKAGSVAQPWEASPKVLPPVAGDRTQQQNILVSGGSVLESVPPIVTSVNPGNFSTEFLTISADDPFARLIVSVAQSELMILTPESGRFRLNLKQGSRLTALASNGYWFQARTTEGRVGFVRRADVSIEVMQYLPVATSVNNR